ncbi:Retrovirus-related Pol polyprotein from type-1 retrotransposable element R2 [Frankliniella fusca]|uniref:Retrovirus-related Pol polyprotein from type-1 retrotransposable element R2 n=1 Tax=Frankliniella fusca TaxID=407009 RepID=A0AAE1L9R2_9NEOP|nr:Retrovirus-related Pol polyprotein from type-1 retrotransposable element R2 [Frankliniella fusca]
MPTPYKREKCRNPSFAEHETLNHITQRCPVTHYASNRHDAGLTHLEPTPGSRIYLILWSMVTTPDTAYVVDVTIAYESYPDSMSRAYAHKYIKNTTPDFVEGVKKMTKLQSISNLPFVIGSRGSWHPANDRVLAIFGLHESTKEVVTTTVLQWGQTIHKIFNAAAWRISAPLHRTAISTRRNKSQQH